jgi:6-pyruvoyltetrahydropterin/6-carboxytetrahydropterin synthase
MPRLSLTRRYHFSASHRLDAPSLDAERNRETYGKCNNPYGHGHNYVLDVTLAGELDPATGRLASIADLDRFVERVILKEMDRRNLNSDVAEFAARVPTTENLARAVAARLTTAWTATASGARIAMVRIQETRRNIFEVKTGASAGS